MGAELWFAIISLALGFIGACFSALASIIAFFVKRGEDAQDKAIAGLGDEQALLGNDIASIKVTLGKYESHIGAGDAKLAEIREDIADHVTKEEQIFWKKVESIGEAHRIFAEAVLQRITSMESRLPNGELQKMAVDVAKLLERFDKVEGMAKDATQHVKEHNEEAERWKRQIEVDAKRLDLLEQRVHDQDDSDTRVNRARRK